MSDATARPKIDIGIAGSAVIFPFKNIPALVQASLGPAMITLAFCFLLFRFMWPADMPINTPEDLQRVQEAFFPADWLIHFAVYVFLAILAVAIHRLIILGEQPGWIVFRFGRYELAYVGAFLLISFGSMLFFTAAYAILVLMALVPTVTLPELYQDPVAVERFVAQWFSGWALIGTLIIFGVLFWLSFRLCLIFPHAAMTGRISLSTSWNATRGNFWRFVGAGILFFLLIFVFYLIIGALFALIAGAFIPFLPISPPPGGGGFGGPATQADPIYLIFFAGAALVSLYVIMAAMGVAFFSFIYRDLVGYEGAAKP